MANLLYYIVSKLVSHCLDNHTLLLFYRKSGIYLVNALLFYFVTSDLSILSFLQEKEPFGV